MKLIDYIKSTRRGSEANAIEREAMSDPFLSDAIEGYDAVYGNHSDKLTEIEAKISKQYTRRRKKARGKITPLYEDADSAKVAKMAEACCEVEAPTIELPAAKIASAKIAMAEEVAQEPQKQEDASNEELPNDSNKSNGSGQRKYLNLSIAAFFAVMAAGVWIYVALNDKADTLDILAIAEKSEGLEQSSIASELEVQEEILAESSEDTGDAKQNATKVEAGEKATIHFIAPEIVDESEILLEDYVKVQDDVKANTSTITASDTKRTQDEISREKQSAVEAERTASQMVISEEAIVVTGYGNSSRETFASSSSTADTKANETVKREQLAEKIPDDIAKENLLKQEEKSDVNLQSTQTAEDIETVINDDFQRFFETNRKITLDSFGEKMVGDVVVEFRVNNKGVPSAIRILSGLTIESNSEIINLLVSGPRWTPTEGKRIRTIVKYE